MLKHPVRVHTYTLVKVREVAPHLEKFVREQSIRTLTNA
jgi:hypothetical protein